MAGHETGEGQGGGGRAAFPDISHWTAEQRVEFAWRQCSSLRRELEKMHSSLKLLAIRHYDNDEERNRILDAVSEGLSGVEDYAASIRRTLSPVEPSAASACTNGAHQMGMEGAEGKSDE